MISFEKQIQKEVQKIRMRTVERRDMRARLVSYIEYHPITAVPVSVRRRQARQPIAAESFTYIRVNFGSWYARATAGVFAVFLLVGVPYAAERAVPGDVLYPVKVRVNEEVFSQLSLSPYEKIEWETRRVERRIAEARLLAKEGRLTPEAETEISAIVKEHTAEAKRGLAALHESNADEAAVAQVALESALDVQSAVLETDTTNADDENDDESANQIRGLAEVVRDAKAGVIADGVVLNASTTPPYGRFVARLEQETTRAQELFSSIGAAMSDKERLDIERRLQDIDRQVGRAQVKFSEGDSAVAVTLTRSALSDTQKLIAFMTDIDIRNTVALESLVPKQLTESERMEAVVLNVPELKRVRTEVLARAESSNDETLRGKIRTGIADLDAMIRDIEISIAAELLGDAEARTLSANALAEDLLLLVKNLPISTTMPSTNPGVQGASTTATTTEESAE